MDAPTAILLVMLLAALYVMVKAQQRDDFDFGRMLRDENGKESALRLAILGSFAVTSWTVCYVTVKEVLEWWHIAIYCFTWSGAAVMRDVAAKWDGRLPWSKQ